jgi:alpha-1,2-mannosyltransferase
MKRSTVPFSFFSLLIFTLSLIQLGFGLFQVLSKTPLIDFSVYYQAASFALQGNFHYNALYNGIPLNYPPSAFLFFVFLPLLPLFPSQMVFTMLSITALLISGIILCRLFPKTKSIPICLLILSCLLQNFPTKFTLVMGQVNIFVLLLLVLSFYMDQKGHQVQSGVFYGLASLFKLTPLPLGLYFLLRKKYKTFFVGIGLVVISNMVGGLLIPDSFKFFYTTFPSLLTANTFMSIYDQSVRAFLARLGIGNTLLITWTLAGLLTLWASWNYKMSLRSHGNQTVTDLTYFSLLLAIITISNGYTWQHHLVLLFPGFIAQTVIVLKEKKIIRVELLLLSAILVAYHFPDIAHPPTTNPILLSHAFIGAGILIGLLLMTRKEKSKIQ